MLENICWWNAVIFWEYTPLNFMEQRCFTISLMFSIHGLNCFVRNVRKTLSSCLTGVWVIKQFEWKCDYCVICIICAAWNLAFFSPPVETNTLELVTIHAFRIPISIFDIAWPEGMQCVLEDLNSFVYPLIRLCSVCTYSQLCDGYTGQSRWLHIWRSEQFGQDVFTEQGKALRGMDALTGRSSSAGTTQTCEHVCVVLL